MYLIPPLLARKLKDISVLRRDRKEVPGTGPVGKETERSIVCTEEESHKVPVPGTGIFCEETEISYWHYW